MTRRTSASGIQSVSPIIPTEVTGCGVQKSVAASKVAGEDGGVSNEILVEEVDYDVEDIQPRRVVPTPATPTQSDMYEHQNDYIPYRVWCKHCVEGYGR